MNTSPIAPATIGQPSVPSHVPAGGLSLMPDPSMDPMAAMYTLMTQQRTGDMLAGKANVEHNAAMRRADLAKEQADFKKQQDAEQAAAAWGIFGKIASLVAIAVSAVASVCSCGAASALCAAACIISATAFAEGQAQVLTKLTGNPDVDKAFQVGAGIAAAICSGGAGIANLGATGAATVAKAMASTGQIVGATCSAGQQALGCVDDKGCQQVAMALGIGGAAASAVGAGAGLGGAVSGAASAADGAKSVARAAADVGGGVADVMNGVDSIGTGQSEADAIDATADAKQVQQSMDMLQRLTQWVVDGLQNSDKAHQQALQTLAGAIQTHDQTLVIASSKV